VVRIVAPENQARSLGSGTLVHVTEKHGLVITNWHVVRDATGPVQVLFPDGFRSAGTVMKTDDDWDLAAIGIWRPQAEPIAIAATAPRPGDLLTIAGYGPGSFRAVSGRCIQYVAPSKTDPNQMIELSGEAREGDSGGPILNSQGQLAGVLLGARDGRTVGSYFGRVDQFLADVRSIMDRTAQPEWIASHTPDPLAPLPQPNGDSLPKDDSLPKNNAAEQEFASQARWPAWPDTVAEPLDTRRDLATAPLAPPVEIPLARAAAQTRRPVAAIGSGGQDEFFRPAITPYPSLREPPARGEQILPPARHPDEPARMTQTLPDNEVVLRLTDIIGTSRSEQIRSVLAAIGVLSLIVFTSRILRIEG
jgi:hypothetical protein